MVACTTAIGSDFGRAVNDVRQQLGLSITDAAKAGGIDRATWWRIETGRSTPSLETAAAIAAVLGIPVGKLIVHDVECTETSVQASKKNNGIRTAAGKRSPDPAS